jgi:ribosomal protein S30
MNLTQEFNRLITYLRREGRFPADSISREESAQHYRTLTGEGKKAAQALYWLLDWDIPHRAAHLASYALESGHDPVGVYLAVNRQQRTKRQTRNQSTANQKKNLDNREINTTDYQTRVKPGASKSLQVID